MAAPGAWKRVALVAIACSVVACGSDEAGDGARDAGPTGDATMPRVELGTGGATFTEIPPTGATLELVHGPQGGFHVDVGVRFWGLDPEGLIVGYLGRDAATGTPMTMPARFELSLRRVVREGDHWVRAGDILVFDVAGPDEVAGRSVEITATLEPPGGTPVSDVRTITVVDDGM